MHEDDCLSYRGKSWAFVHCVVSFPFITLESGKWKSSIFINLWLHIIIVTHRTPLCCTCHHFHPSHHQDNCQTLSTIFLSQLLSSTGSAIVLPLSRSSFSSVARQHNLCQHYLRFALLSRACVSSSTVGSVSQTDHLVLLVLERIREWSVGSFVAELVVGFIMAVVHSSY